MTTISPATTAPVPAPDGPPDLLWVETWPDDEEGAPSGPAPAGSPGSGPGAIVDHPTRGPGRGHLLRSRYVETYWLPILGPSSIALLRMLAAGLVLSPGGFTLDVPEAARSLGIGHRGGRNGPMARTIQRCCAFGATRIDHGHQLLVRTQLATLTPRQLSRLPVVLQQGHVDALSAAKRTIDDDQTGVSAVRERCRVLALSLLEIGETATGAEEQLHRWRFHPALAHESVTWAQGQLQARR